MEEKPLGSAQSTALDKRRAENFHCPKKCRNIAPKGREFRLKTDEEVLHLISCRLAR